MNGPPERRPPLATSVSAPCIFSRPMDPAPAPLVYINGWHGIGKETVAECLTLLLGRDKSLLIDVRSVGCEAATTTTSCCGSNGASHNPNNNHQHQHQRTHRHDPNRQYDHRPLLTPEHPRYFSFDADPDDQDPDVEDPDDPNLDTPSTNTTPTAAINTNPASNPSTTTTSRSASFSSASTNITAATTATASSISSSASSTTPSPLLPLLVSEPQSQSLSQPQPQPHPEPTDPDHLPTPCSSENLTALLSHPPNRSRIAILPACAPDTPAGRAAVRTFEAAAARAGRVFVAVALACEPVEHARRVEEGRVKGFSLLRGGAGGLGLGLRGRRRGRGLSESFASLAVGGGAAGANGVGGSRRGSVDGGGGGGAGSDVDGVEGRLRGLSLPVPLRPAIIPEVDEDGVVGAAAAAAGEGMGMGVGWLEGLAAPVKAGLTVDVTRVPVFEAALQIVEFVRAREAERDAELCCRGVAKTAATGLAGEGRRASHAA